MRKIALTTLFVSSNMFGQVGIGTTQPNPSAVLDIQSTNKGVLIPRVELNSIYDPTIGVSTKQSNINHEQKNKENNATEIMNDSTALKKEKTVKTKQKRRAK